MKGTKNINFKVYRKSKCNFCNKDNLEVEDFGAYYICKDCKIALVKEYSLKIRKAKKRVDLTINKPNSNSSSKAYYEPLNSTIILTGEGTERESIKSISHETLHYVLHKTLSIIESYKFDGIAYKYYYLEDIAYGVINIEL